MGFETTKRAPLRVFPTTLGAFASVADTVLCWSDEQFVVHRLDKLDGLVLGHQPVAPGA